MGYKLALFMLVAFLATLPLALAQETFYADIQGTLDESGTLALSGITNHPVLAVESTQRFTSKQGTLWLLNISPEGIFSDYIWTITLPQRSQITYIKTDAQIRISSEQDRTVIRGTGTDEPMDIVIQYTTNAQPEIADVASIISIGVLILAILTGIVLWYARGYPRRRNAPAMHEQDTKDPWYDTSLLPARQRAIVAMIEKGGGKIAQSKLDNELDMPKSSLSRNVASLVRRGILARHRLGMTNVLAINKKPPTSPDVPQNSAQFRQR